MQHLKKYYDNSLENLGNWNLLRPAMGSSCYGAEQTLQRMHDRRRRPVSFLMKPPSSFS